MRAEVRADGPPPQPARAVAPALLRQLVAPEAVIVLDNYQPRELLQAEVRPVARVESEHLKGTRARGKQTVTLDVSWSAQHTQDEESGISRFEARKKDKTRRDKKALYVNYLI